MVSETEQLTPLPPGTSKQEKMTGIVIYLVIFEWYYIV